MKKIVFNLVVVLTALVSVVSCNKGEKSNDILEKKNVEEEIFKISEYFFEESKKNKTFYSMNENEIREKYKKNLDYISKKLGIKLNFEEKEFQVLFAKRVGKKFELSYLYSSKNQDENTFLKSKEIFDEAEKILKGRRMTWGCGIALAGNFAASLSLISCVTGAFCPLAVASKALAMAGVVASCADF